MISEEKIQNSLYNNELNDTIKSFPTTENLNQSNKININNIGKIMIVPINETNEKKIEIEIKIIKRCCCIIFKHQLSTCCTHYKYECESFCKKIKKYVFFVISLAACFFFFGGFLFFV